MPGFWTDRGGNSKRSTSQRRQRLRRSRIAPPPRPNIRARGDQAGAIERNDAAGEGGEAEREKELAGPAQPTEGPLPALCGRGVKGNIAQNQGRRGALGVQAWIRLRSIKQWPKLPVGSIASLRYASPSHLTRDALWRQSTSHARVANQVSLKR